MHFVPTWINKKGANMSDNNVSESERHEIMSIMNTINMGINRINEIMNKGDKQNTANYYFRYIESEDLTKESLKRLLDGYNIKHIAVHEFYGDKQVEKYFRGPKMSENIKTRCDLDNTEFFFRKNFKDISLVAMLAMRVWAKDYPGIMRWTYMGKKLHPRMTSGSVNETNTNYTLANYIVRRNDDGALRLFRPGSWVGVTDNQKDRDYNPIDIIAEYTANNKLFQESLIVGYQR